MSVWMDIGTLLVAKQKQRPRPMQTAQLLHATLCQGSSESDP